MKVFPSSLRFIISGLTIASLGSFAVKASAEYQQIPTNDNSRIDTFSDTSNQLAEIRSDFQKRSQEFSLEDATHYAIANNSTIQAAYKGVQSEQWNAISDKRLWWPRVSGAGPMGDITTIPTFPLMVNDTHQRKGDHSAHQQHQASQQVHIQSSTRLLPEFKQSGRFST